MSRPVRLIQLAALLCALLVFGSGQFAHIVLPALSPAPVYSQTADRSPSEDRVAAQQSAADSLAHLKQVMDAFHTHLPVYDDVSSPGNHFHAWGKIPDQTASVEINGSSTDNPHTGATAIRCAFLNTPGPNFGGFYFLNGILPPGEQAPLLNFGEEANAGIDLSGATQLTFWARGEQGNEVIEFFMGGVGRDPVNGAPMPDIPHPGSTPVVKISAALTTEWQQYSINLSGRDLRYVLGGFGWVANDTGNPNGAVFYLDDIQYELSPTRRAQRLREPRFLRSYTTEPFQRQPSPVNDLDLVLRNTAFTYDNALTLLAFLAVGTNEALDRAQLIGDAFVYAAQNDRTFDDGRLRTAYAAGDISLPPGWTPSGRVGTVPVSGFFDEEQQVFVEVEQDAVDVGNNAWATIALLGLFHRTNESIYLETAIRIAEFIRTFRIDTGQFQGFQGGFNNPESATPVRRPWASTEHNLDVYAAFSMLFQITGDSAWQSEAQHARQFVEAMRDAQQGCYLAGSIDPDTRNENAGQLPLDTQSWGILSLSDAATLHPQLLTCAEQHHHTSDEGFSGFDFNEDNDGVWFEGTAQMAVAYLLAGQPETAEEMRQELRRAQQTSPFGDGRGIAAASHEGVSTGFGFELFRRLHIAATAWNLFAQLGFNPFYPAVETIRATFESPEAGPVSGIAAIQGWAFAPEAGVQIRTVELFLDDVQVGTIPCCSERGDVRAAFPEFSAENTLNSGWGITFNWGILSPGIHTVQVGIRSTRGELFLTAARTVTIVKPGDFEFLDQFSLAQASASIDGNALILEGVVVRDSLTQQETEIDTQFRWFTSAQALRMVEAVTIIEISSLRSRFSALVNAVVARVVEWVRAPRVLANPGLVATFESPGDGLIVSGGAILHGWAFAEEEGESITAVRLVLDGELGSTIPCCSERADVAAVFPTHSNALTSGWGMTFNYGLLRSGGHTIGVQIADSAGVFLAVTHHVTVVRLGGFEFLDQFDLSGATAKIEGEEIIIEGVGIRDQATQQTKVIDVRLRWLTSSQSLGIVSSVG